MPDVTPFTVPAQFAKSTTPPTAFASGIAAPSTTAPGAFSAAGTLLADITALKALPTVQLAVATTLRQVASSVSGEVMQVWRLVAGNHADDVAHGYARPADYDDETNAKYWVREI